MGFDSQQIKLVREGDRLELHHPISRFELLRLQGIGIHLRHIGGTLYQCLRRAGALRQVA